MSQRTPRQNLIVNNGSDPFLLSDFVTNLNTLDSAPGIAPCTSSTRPVWGANQSGRLIYETDTRRIIAWSGTAWVEPTAATGEWHASVNPNTTMGPSAAATHTMGTLTALRPCSVLFMIKMHCAMALTGQGNYIIGSLLVDGGDRTIGGQQLDSYMQWPSISSPSQAGLDHRHITFFGFASLTVGNHSIATKFTTGTAASTQIRNYGVSVAGLIVAGAAGASTL